MISGVVLAYYKLHVLARGRVPVGNQGCLVTHYYPCHNYKTLAPTYGYPVGIWPPLRIPPGPWVLPSLYSHSVIVTETVDGDSQRQRRKIIDMKVLNHEVLESRIDIHLNSNYK